MRKLILPLAMLAMALLLGAAVVIDCVRLAHNAEHRADLADAEMAKNELRLANVIDGSPKATPEVHATIAKLRSAQGRGERIDAYNSLVANLRNTISSQIDATNPLDRKFMDEAAGAMNRREVAQKEYDEELVPYGAYMKTWRGKVAMAFSGSK
jgi:uncharacterized protein YPO0396